jgi:hypothetical protein
MDESGYHGFKGSGVKGVKVMTREEDRTLSV